MGSEGAMFFLIGVCGLNPILVQTWVCDVDIFKGEKLHDFEIIVPLYSQSMTKQTNWPGRPAKTLISFGICRVLSVYAVHLKTVCVLSYH